MASNDRYNSKKTYRVNVYGAGVTGLTVAHELARRGFKVTVFEKEQDPDVETRCRVGGMAATQYLQAPDPIPNSCDFVELSPIVPWSECNRLCLGEKRQSADEKKGEKIIEADAEKNTDKDAEKNTEKNAEKIIEADAEKNAEKITEADAKKITEFAERIEQDIIAFVQPIKHAKTFLSLRIHVRASDGSGRDIADRVLDALGKVFKTGEVTESPPSLKHIGELLQGSPLKSLVKSKENGASEYIEQKIGDILQEYIDCKYKESRKRRRISIPDTKVVLLLRDSVTELVGSAEPEVEVSLERSRVPGEHGYRFFPGFYRNLTKTMRDTPLYHPRTRQPLNNRNTLDNLTPTTRTAYADPNHQLIILQRCRVNSLEQLRRELETLLGSLHYSRQDILRMQLKIFRFMTSCRARRQGYEEQSWWDFIEGRKFSPAAQEHIQNTPEALVAMSARHSDARTQGNILVQLLRDQLNDGERTDMVLNGPTSESWLEHWRLHLRALGVRFRKAELMTFAETSLQVIPIGWPKTRDDDEAIPDYVVLATDVVNARRVVKHLNAEPDSAVGKLQSYGLNQTDRQPVVTDRLRLFSGIQLFFDSRIDMLDGHIFYTKSPWGLTSISQTQFWPTHLGGESYMTILSVIAGRFDVPGLGGKAMWECTKKEIAWDVWRQIRASMPNKGLPKRPTLYHVDENLIFDRFDRFTFRVGQLAKADGDEKWTWSRPAQVTIKQAERIPKPLERSSATTIKEKRIQRNARLEFEAKGEPKRRPMNGTLSQGHNSTWCYEPHADFEGHDVFSFKESDEKDYQIVSVVVGGDITAFRAYDGALEVDCEEKSAVINLQELIEPSGSDPTDLRLQIVEPPEFGTLTRTPKSWEVTGNFEFTYEYEPSKQAEGNRLGENRSPFHVNPVGDWKHRPGVLPKDCQPHRDHDLHHAPWPPPTYFKHNVYKNLVLAGTYLKTYTRLNTMEAANESGRHAVNTILADIEMKHGLVVGEPCEIWDPEDHEIDDLANLKLLDQALYDAGLPHVADILELDKLPDMLIERRPDDLSLRPDFERFSRMLRNYPGLPKQAEELLTKLARGGLDELGRTLPRSLGDIFEFGKHGGTAIDLGKRLLEWLEQATREEGKR